jgi:hypothetical protein
MPKFRLFESGDRVSVPAPIAKFLEERSPMFKSAIFPEAVTKAAAHRFAVYTAHPSGDGMAFHSSHATRGAAHNAARELGEDGHRDVMVRDLHQDEEDSEADMHHMRKSPKVRDDDDDDMSAAELEARNLAAKRMRRPSPGLEEDGKRKTRKVSFNDVVFGGDQSGTKAFDPTELNVDDTGARAGERPWHGMGYPEPDSERSHPHSDEDERDALGRNYGQEVLDRIAGGWSKTSGTDPDLRPNPGSGPTWHGTSEDVPDGLYRPFAAGEGDRGRVGGEDRGYPRGGRFYTDEPGAYDFSEPSEELTSAGERIADMHLLKPGASGITAAAGAQFPDIATQVSKAARATRKSVGAGRFTSAIFGGEACGFADGWR